MADSSLLKRSFRNVAVVAGLIERRRPGAEKSGRQVTVSSDLIYDVLRKHEPDHVLLRATRAEAEDALLAEAAAELATEALGPATPEVKAIEPCGGSALVAVYAEPRAGAP